MELLQKELEKKCIKYQQNIKFCITHLPQIAALSDYHYFVSKKVKDSKTFTQIRTLSKYDKIKEIAKMIGGDEISELL